MPGTAYVTEFDLEDRSRSWKRRIDEIAEHALAALAQPALLVIDMQRYFAEPKGKAYLPAARTVLPNIVALITAFRTKGFPVLFTRHGHVRGETSPTMEEWWRGRLLYEDDEGAELMDDLGAREQKMIIRKQHYDAFRGTSLAHALSRLDVESLVLCGVMTDLCVETTARQAFMEGFQPVVVLDATASKTEELHLAALTTLAHGFACIETTQRIRELLV